MRSCPRKCDDLRVDEETQRGRARNEAMFRQVNEGIQRGHWPGEEHKPMGFRCECAKIGCNAIVSMSSGTYERIRDHPQWFLLLPGHELDEIETIVAYLTTRGGQVAILFQNSTGGATLVPFPR